MSYETYHIPVNFTDAGKLFGVFEIRNAVETVLLCVPILFLCLALLPLTLMPKIIVTMAILVPVGGFALIGIGGDSLTRWLKAWMHWRKHRRMIFYRGEARLARRPSRHSRHACLSGAAANGKRPRGEQERNLFAPDRVLHSGCDICRNAAQHELAVVILRSVADGICLGSKKQNDLVGELLQRPFCGRFQKGR